MAVTIGTAGHIDHGKTALVRALTGVDGDRLPEERARGITIELGFAPLDLPSASASSGVRCVGVVDVPGHERFVRTMLAGAAAIDAGLIVVAADDGVMPQTREHVAILDLLGVRRAVVALTKCDLAEPAWRALVAEDVRDLLASHGLAGAPVVETSVKTGSGIDALRAALAEAADAVEADPARPGPDGGDRPFRLMIDRAFALAGRGTVVTGTVASGEVREGDTLELLPDGRSVRVRGVHVHGDAAAAAPRGSRVALALAGVHHAEIGRGDELAAASRVRCGTIFAGTLRLLPGMEDAVRPRERVRLHLGTAVHGARLRRLDGGPGPGSADGRNDRLVQVAVDGPVPAVFGQPFVIRAESPAVTLGGGRVLQPAARPLHRRDASRLDRLIRLAAAENGAERLELAWGLRPEPSQLRTRAWADAGLDDAAAAEAVADRVAAGRLHAVSVPGEDGPVFVSGVTVDGWIDALVRALDRHHTAAPLSAGLPRDQLDGAVPGVPARHRGLALDAAIAAGRVVVAGGDRLARAGFAPDLSPAHRRLRERLVTAYRAAGFRPPDVEVAAGAGARKDATRAMVSLSVAEGDLVHIGGGTFLATEHERELRERVRRHLAGLDAPGGLTMSELRVLLETTRKYAVPFGEHLDRTGVTRRRGDVRVLVDA